MANAILFKECKDGDHKKCKYHVVDIFCNCSCHKNEKIRPFETKESRQKRKITEKIIAYANSLDW